MATGTPAPQDFALEAAIAAGRWIVAERSDASAKSDSPEERGARLHLYAGTSGVLLFLRRLADATGEPWAAEAAAAAAAELLDVAEAPDMVPAAGLYTGLGGIAFALGEHEGSTGAADRLVDELVDRLPSPGAWTDIIAGTAGYGLTLLWAADSLGRDDALAAASTTGEQLLAAAEPASPRDAGRCWRMQPSDEFVMPNFSHGTAGVAFFLARLAAATGEERFLAAALGGARHLMEIASNAAGLVHHHAPGGESLHYLGWCHGPPGTTRLFWELGQNDAAWNKAGDQLTEGLLRTGIPEVRTEGFWNNVGRCCGDAGVAEFAQDLIDMGRDRDGRITELRDACTANVLRAAVEMETPLGPGMSWPHAEHRARPEQIEATTGLMQGAAGIGLWLLRAAGMRPRRMPDDPRLQGESSLG